ncbi:MAG: T9SS type A sorting domain-containing protein [Bacteroidetes bacterium]|nr:T9SS type A sorting domain-containing protein [Bacteroidota bacterium]
MAISSQNELYVAGFNNDQVVVFDLDGNFLRTFTGGSLNGTNCVALDSHGAIYVSSALNALILKFDANENFLFEFTGGGLLSPMSIARNTNDILYISGGSSNNIVKFDTFGNMLGTITHPDLPVPQGIAFDDRGHFFSSSFSQNKIVEFDENDNYVQTITAGNLQVPRSIAFEQLNPVTSVDNVITVTEFELEQNYPNPFNPSTKITFTIPSNVKREKSNVTLKIYDVIGNEVAILINKEMQSGSYEVEFSAAGGGKRLPSGVYFYQLRAGNPSASSGQGFTDTKKMILLK